MLQELLERIDTYIGSLIDIADMSTDDKAMPKLHLLAAQEILVRNGANELKEFVAGVSKAILSRF